MPDHIAPKDPLEGVDQGRRKFLKTVLAGSAIAVPVVVSMSLTGAGLAPQAPGVSGATTTAQPGSTPTPGPTPSPTPSEVPTEAPSTTVAP